MGLATGNLPRIAGGQDEDNARTEGGEDEGPKSSGHKDSKNPEIR